MSEIPEDVLDEVISALEVLTTGHGFSVANTGGGYPINTAYELAAEYGCSHHNIRSIWKGQSWRDLL